MTEQRTSDTTIVTIYGEPGGPRNVSLTRDQEDIREAWKAQVAGLLMGRHWILARETLVQSGLPIDAVEETLMDAVSELLEDGWDDYRP